MSDHVSLWLVGAGGMAQEYARVLGALKVPFEVIGRDAATADRFTERTGLPVRRDGLEAFLAGGPKPATHAIVATNVETLSDLSRRLIAHGVGRILVEKPAGLDVEEIAGLAEAARARGAHVQVAYNRRFYASVQRARELIAEDGGVTSFHFEFTEWGHEVVASPISAEVKRHWLLANSSHVIDLAFYLGGEPRQIHALTAGGLPWHPSASAFAGAGVTEAGALFSYHANWAAPGRWSVELMTRQRQFIFRPLEKLQVQKLASVAIEELPLDDRLDKEFKPGLYREVAAFLSTEAADGGVLPDIFDHLRRAREWARIGSAER